MSHNTTQSRIGRLKDASVAFAKPLFENRLRKVAVGILVIYLFVAVFGSHLAPTGAYESVRLADGSYAILNEPTAAHPFGTTEAGYSVLSQTILAFRTSMFIGLSSAVVLLTIGINVGLIAGYYGGWVETALMGLVDLAYGLPFLPFAIVFVALIEQSIWALTAVIGLLLWRAIARITRSETLSLKEREFVKSARAVGSSDLKIMYYHILPNLIPVIVVYFVLGAVYGILTEASLSFIGLGDPNSISWGVMLFNAFQSGSFSTAWWWVVPPSLALWTFIWSLFIIARGLEENVETASVEQGR